MADSDLTDLFKALGTGLSVAGTATAVQGKLLGVDAANIRAQGAAAATKGALDAALLGSEAATAQANQAGINADLLSGEVDLSKLATDATYAKGVFDENNFRAKLGRVEATQLADFGARHIDPTTGSPLLLAGFTAAQGEVDARLIRANSQVEAAGTIAQTASLENQAAGARETQYASLLKASQILTGGIDTADAGVFSVQAAGIDAKAAETGATTQLLSGAAKLWQGLYPAKSAGALNNTDSFGGVN